MEYAIASLVSVLFVVVPIVSFFFLREIYELRAKIAELHYKVADVRYETPSNAEYESVDLEDYSDVSDELSDYEIERLERERDFERRIRSMKEELGIEESKAYKRTAEESHPNVKNLPHNIIPSYDDLPSVEHAD